MGIENKSMLTRSFANVRDEYTKLIEDMYEEDEIGIGLKLTNIAYQCAKELDVFRSTKNGLSEDEYKKAYENLYFTKTILEISIQAKNNYYSHSNWGEFSKIIQDLLFSLFGCKTTLTIAQEVYDDYDTELTQMCASPHLAEFNPKKNDEINGSNLWVNLSRLRQRDYYITEASEQQDDNNVNSSTPNSSLPSTLVSCKDGVHYKFLPNGKKQTGGSKICYEARAILPSDKKPDKKAIPVALLTAKPGVKDPAMVNKAIAKEGKFLTGPLAHTPGVINTYKLFSGEESFLIQELGKTCVHTFLHCDPQAETRTNWEAEKILLMGKIIDPVYNVHERGYLLLDLKPENIIINFDDKNILSVALIDFGNKVKIDGNDSERKYFTGPYLPPEGALSYIQRANKKIGDEEMYKLFNQKYDTWALGTILYSIYFGEQFIYNCFGLQFDSKSCIEQMKSISKIKQTNINDSFLNFDPIAQLIKKMLTVDPAQRPTMAEVKKEWDSIQKKTTSMI